MLTSAVSPETVTEAPFYGGRLRLRQPESGYRAAIDPVLLAARLAPRPGSVWLDLGCGVGAARLCLLARCPAISVIGVEIDPLLADLARQNAALNGFSDRFRIIESDVAALPATDLPALAGIFTNPPFHAPAATPSPDGRRARATHGDVWTDWCAVAARLLPHRGSFSLITRADALAEVLAAFAAARPAFGGITLLPLWPRAGQAAKRLLVTARLGSRAPLVLGAGLVLHAAGNAYTAECDAILRGGASLENR